VLRVLRDQAPFMQKNVPKYTPDFVKTVPIWAEASKREVHYALCDDRQTLLWFANQRAVEYHPTLGLADNIYRPTHMVLDLDPPDDDAFSAVVAVAHLVRRALADSGLEGAVKTSGAKGIHVFVPIDDSAPVDDVAAATRALAARAEALDPQVATTAFIVEDRGGKVFVDSTRAGELRSPPPTAPACGPARRSRSRWTGRNWTASTPPTSRCTPRSMHSPTMTRGRNQCPIPNGCLAI
jgi:DNA ligase D-like protein (predicted polymerase)